MFYCFRCNENHHGRDCPLDSSGSLLSSCLLTPTEPLVSYVEPFVPKVKLPEIEPVVPLLTRRESLIPEFETYVPKVELPKSEPLAPLLPERDRTLDGGFWHAGPSCVDPPGIDRYGPPSPMRGHPGQQIMERVRDFRSNDMKMPK